MSPLAVVEQFDVLEQLAAGLSSGTPLALIDQFDFECGEKTFRHRVVPAVAFTAHAALNAVYRQQLLIIVAGVLTAAIRVVQQTLRRVAGLLCPLSGDQRDGPGGCRSGRDSRDKSPQLRAPTFDLPGYAGRPAVYTRRSIPRARL